MQGPRCWEAMRRAHRAGGVMGPQRTPPEPSPGYRSPIWASPVMETLEFICKRENCVSENGTCLSVPNTGEGNGNPLQYSRLKNSMDRGAWWASHGSSWLDLSDFTLHTHQLIRQETGAWPHPGFSEVASNPGLALAPGSKLFSSPFPPGCTVWV